MRYVRKIGLQCKKERSGLKDIYSVAIIYICTGQYAHFWREFYISLENHFLKKSNIEYFVFTDAERIYGEDQNKRIHKIHQENLGWPGNTLFRFKMFMSISEKLLLFDFCFFFNANIVFCEDICEEEFLPIEAKLLMVQHPGYFKSNRFKFPYERKKESKAYIPYGKGDVYVYGAINGGHIDSFLKMSRELATNIDYDLQNGFVAKWHDESHLNNYVWKNGDYKLLSPAYAYPEGLVLPFKKKIVILDKRTRIQLDKDKLFELEQKSILKRLKHRFFIANQKKV